MKSRYDEFSSLILSINKSIQRIKNFEMECFGLKGNQVQCIYHLYNEEGGITPTQLSLLCGEDKGAMSRTIKELEKGDYLYIEEVGKQKYRNPIKLTQRGKELGQMVSERVDKIFKEGSNGVEEEDRKDFYRRLGLVEGNLQEICKRYGEKNGNKISS